MAIVAIIHEAGHLLAALVFKRKVESIGIFYGTILKFCIKETSIHIGIIPLGAYIKVNGLEQLKQGQLRIFAAAGIIANLLTALAVFPLYDILPFRAIFILSAGTALLNLIPYGKLDGAAIWR